MTVWRKFREDDDPEDGDSILPFDGEDDDPEPSPKTAAGTVTQLPVPAPDPEIGTDLAVLSGALPVGSAPGRVRTAVEKAAARPLVPSRQAAVAQATWWAVHLGRLTGWLLLHPWKLFSELRPIAAGLGALATGWARWVTHAEQAGHVKVAGPTDRAKHGEKVEKRREGRRRLSGVVAVFVLSGVGYLLLTGQTTVLVGIGVGVVAVCDAVGRKVRKAKPVTATRAVPRSPMREGMPIHMVAQEVERTLTERGHVPTVAEGRIVEHGLSLTLHSSTEITDEDVEALERRLQLFPGAVARIQDRKNAALGELRLMWEDPLDRLVVPPLYAPLSQDIRLPAYMGVGWTGKVLHLNLLRTNVIIVGGPGSGKSSLATAMADYVTACMNARLSVIDLSDGPFGHSWGDLVRLETTVAGAKGLLRESIDRAKRRTSQISGRSRPTAGGLPVAGGTENWDPTLDGGAQHVIAIDEGPLLSAEQELRELYAEHQRIGRKAGENSWFMAQDISGDTIKATSLRKYPSTTIMLACSREDVISLMGGGMLKRGWRPDRLVPAEGDDANDAGKGFVHSGSHQTPTPYRFPRVPDLGAIHSRAHARILAGLPELGDPAGSGGGRPGDPEIVDAAEVPPMLAAVEQVFADAGDPDRLPTADVVAALIEKGYRGVNATSLAKALAGTKLKPRDTRWQPEGPDGPRVRGYWLDDVQAAIRAV